MLYRLIISLLVYALLLANPVNADEPEQSLIFPEVGQVYFYLGDFDAETTGNELQNPGSEFAFGMGLLFEHSAHLDWGFDFIVFFREYDTPPAVSGGSFTVVSDDMGLTTMGMAINTQFDYTTGIIRLYAGAGAGLYLSKLTLTASTFGFPGTHEERSSGFGYFYHYGVMLRPGNEDYLGVEYRNLLLDANLSPVTVGSVDVGGELVLISYIFKF